MFRKNLIEKYICSGFEHFEARSEVDFAIEVIANLKAKELLMGETPSLPKLEQIRKAITERLATKRPIQQILKQAIFMGEKFVVNEHTLIPRPETEILVLKAAEFISNKSHCSILDIGTGSGCIPIMLAKICPTRDLTITAVDICQNALKVANTNAKNLNVSDKISFIQSDLFSNIADKYDLIISNPPYIPFSEKANLQSEVRDFEPATALFAYDAAGIEFYDKILSSAPKYLKKSGGLFFELGLGQSEAVKNIMLKVDFCNINVTKDLDGINRVISGVLN